jgi:cell division protein FtsQ
MKKWLIHISAAGIVIVFAVLMLMYRSIGSAHRQGLECKGVSICVTDSAMNSFISCSDVKKYLDTEYGTYTGCRIDSVDLDSIEDILKGKTAVLNSEVYVTKDGLLNISIEQRKPAVRFIGKNGGFYADENGETFPLQKTYSSYVPVIDGDIPSENDSICIRKMVRLVNYLENSSRWKNKIVQISTDSTGNLTLIPREGQEKFIFGQAEDIENKMDRMTLYYSHIIPEKGSKAYRSVDLRYDNQIICK